MIPEILLKDIGALKERGFAFKIIEEGLKIYLWFNNFPLPSGCYNLEKTDLLIFTSVHYPHAGFDMFWTNQDLTLSDGSIPKQADSIETHLGGNWRRFSYHPYQNSSWNPGEDDVAKYLGYVQQRLQNGN